MASRNAPVRAVTIDLDGTLLDTVPDLASAADAMLAELDRRPLGPDVVRDFVGKGIPNLVRRCLAVESEPDDASFARALETFQHHYARTNGRQTQIYPGVREGLDAMRAMGLPLGCVTNKATAFTVPLLAMTGLDGYFGALVCGDTLPEKKPHPMPLLHLFRELGAEPAESLHIGDSVNDVEAARAAGCRVLCVPYGYNEGRDVRELDCDAIVADLDEAARWIGA